MFLDIKPKFSFTSKNKTKISPFRDIGGIIGFPIKDFGNDPSPSPWSFNIEN